MPLTTRRETSPGPGFAIIEAAALASERCPTNETIASAAVRKLAKAGQIRIEVGFHNWRVVKILTGPAKGRSTAYPTDGKGWRPYVIIGREGREYPRVKR